MFRILVTEQSNECHIYQSKYCKNKKLCTTSSYFAQAYDKLFFQFKKHFPTIRMVFPAVPLSAAGVGAWVMISCSRLVGVKLGSEYRSLEILTNCETRLHHEQTSQIMLSALKNVGNNGVSNTTGYYFRLSCQRVQSGSYTLPVISSHVISWESRSIFKQNRHCGATTCCNVNTLQ